MPTYAPIFKTRASPTTRSASRTPPRTAAQPAPAASENGIPETDADMRPSTPPPKDPAVKEFVAGSPEYRHIEQGQQEAELEFESMAAQDDKADEDEELVPLPKLLQLGEENINEM